MFNFDKIRVKKIQDDTRSQRHSLIRVDVFLCLVFLVLFFLIFEAGINPPLAGEKGGGI